MEPKLPIETAEESIPRSLVSSINIVPETLEDMKFWELFYPRGIDKKRRYKLTHPNWQKEWWQKLKLEVITHYGEGKCACVRCGYTDLRALSIDHIDGNGTRQRRSNPRYSPSQFYGTLKRRGYPEGFQTLCMNCQFIKRVENNEFSQAEKPSGS